MRKKTLEDREEKEGRKDEELGKKGRGEQTRVIFFYYFRV